MIAVIADLNTRIDRIIKRDGIDRDAAIKRINSQISDERLSALADFTLENNGDAAQIEAAVSNLIKIINQGDI